MNTIPQTCHDTTGWQAGFMSVLPAVKPTPRFASVTCQPSSGRKPSRRRSPAPVQLPAFGIARPARCRPSRHRWPTLP